MSATASCPSVTPPEKPTHILFVCLGNICRSPAAEIVMRHFVREDGREDEFVIDSAGTAGYHEGSMPDSRMAATLRQNGYAISGRARQIRREDLDRFDLIVPMDEQNLADVRHLDRDGSHDAKIRPFVSFCTEHDDRRVPDPYYGGQRGFDHVVKLLEDGCRGILDGFAAK